MILPWAVVFTGIQEEATACVMILPYVSSRLKGPVPWPVNESRAQMDLIEVNIDRQLNCISAREPRASTRPAEHTARIPGHSDEMCQIAGEEYILKRGGLETVSEFKELEGGGGDT